MKKRLLITSALMTAVLGASLATGTYAWYSATEGTFVKGAMGSETISTVDNAYSVGDITLNVVFADPSGEVKLSDTDGYSYVWVGGVKTKDTSVAQNDASMYGTIGVSITATTTRGNATADELKAIKGTYNLTVTASGQAKISLESGAAAIAATKGNTATIVVTISDAGAISLDKSTIYFAMQGDEAKTDGSEAGSVTATNLVEA